VEKMDLNYLKKADPEIHAAIMSELKRQRETVELIASENFTSEAVMETVGTWLTNKYSEGYSTKRYYGGNQFIDQCETLAINRVKKLFDAEHANVQPHSGSQANMAAYYSVLDVGDKIMSMELSHGGHLTHGSPVNFSGKWYKMAFYPLDKETETLDYDVIMKMAEKEKPKLILCGYTAYSRTIDFKAFREAADAAGAYLMTDMAHIAGLIAAGEHPSPVSYADIVTSTTHKTLRGPRGAFILSKENDRVRPEIKKTLAQRVGSAVFPGLQGGPLDHVIAAKAICFKEAMTPEFRGYQKQTVKNAKAMAERLIENGLRIVSGGTDNHLMLVDLTNKNIGGKEAQNILDEAGITANRNMIPYDKRTPFDPSGIRFGTPALTTRGMKESEMKQVADWIGKILNNPTDSALRQKVKTEVTDLCSRFPLYPEL
jgi:glycine hydroxymethyltransferase